jgi:hypothetical protein
MTWRWVVGGGGSERRVVALASAAARLMRAYSGQVETLRRLRHGGDQHVRVEHIHINGGAQAVIGTVRPPDRKHDATTGADRFEGRPREGARKVDVSHLMRRLTKEELRKFDGAPLFPERKAYTIQYQLSDLEAQLYAAVTQYVRNEMRNLNNLGDDKRKNNVGFALQILQRRLASSPAAIFHSLRRRRERLEAKLAEEEHLAYGALYRVGARSVERFLAIRGVLQWAGAWIAREFELYSTAKASV